MKPFRKKILVQLGQYIYKKRCVYSQSFLVFHLSYLPIFCGMNERLSYCSMTSRIFRANGSMVGWWGEEHGNGQEEGESARIYSKGKKNPTMLNPFNFMLWSFVSHIITHRFRNPLFVWAVDCLCSRWLIRQESCLGNSIIRCRTKYMINVNLRVS